MFEIVKLGERTYYIPNATNIGMYLENEKDVWLIDTGIDADCGKKILKAIDEKGWTVKGIICTHSHADHIGGNHIIVKKTGCVVLAHGAEHGIAESTFLNNTAVFGGYPYEGITNKFFYSEPFGKVLELSENLPSGLEFFPLRGHTFDMIGIKTPDNVYFIADAVISEITVTKYHIFYLYDIAKQFETLAMLQSLASGNKEHNITVTYVPSHSEATTDIDELIKLNKDKIVEIRDYLLYILRIPTTLENVVHAVFEHYNLRMNAVQHTLVMSTMRSYLSYLSNSGLIEIVFGDNYLKYKTV